jgi:hypothetical protein
MQASGEAHRSLCARCAAAHRGQSRRPRRSPDARICKDISITTTAARFIVAAILGARRTGAPMDGRLAAVQLCPRPNIRLLYLEIDGCLMPDESINMDARNHHPRRRLPAAARLCGAEYVLGRLSLGSAVLHALTDDQRRPGCRPAAPTAFTAGADLLPGADAYSTVMGAASGATYTAPGEQPALDGHVLHAARTPAVQLGGSHSHDIRVRMSAPMHCSPPAKHTCCPAGAKVMQPVVIGALLADPPLLVLPSVHPKRQSCSAKAVGSRAQTRLC